MFAKLYIRFALKFQLKEDFYRTFFYLLIIISVYVIKYCNTIVMKVLTFVYFLSFHLKMKTVMCTVLFWSTQMERTWLCVMYSTVIMYWVMVAVQWAFSQEVTLHYETYRRPAPCSGSLLNSINKYILMQPYIILTCQENS